jgi:hypothetical protein
VRGNKMAEMVLGTNNRNKPKDGRSNFVLDKGNKKADLEVKYLGRLRNQLHTQVRRHSSLSSWIRKTRENIPKGRCLKG